MEDSILATPLLKLGPTSLLAARESCIKCRAWSAAEYYPSTVPKRQVYPFTRSSWWYCPEYSIYCSMYMHATPAVTLFVSRCTGSRVRYSSLVASA